MRHLRAKWKLASLSTAVCAVLSMMFAFVAAVSPQNCDCSQRVLSSPGISSGCCSSQQEPQNCCRSKQPSAAGKCCCNPDATECLCSGCSCREVNDPAPVPVSVPPGQQTVDLVSTGTIGDVSAFAVAWPEPENELPSVNGFFDFILTAQQKCVLLSRFNC